MASNLHKDLTDLQLHVPKGFASAANSTTCQKDATGNLVWAAGGGGGSSNEINTTSFRGAFNNKTGGATNWKGFSDAYLMNNDFGNSSTADFSPNWDDIIPATVHVVTSANPTLTKFQGQIITSAAVTVELSLWFVRPLCAGANKGLMKLIKNETFIATGTYDCFDITLTQGLLSGDIIVPLIKSNLNGLCEFSSTMRFVQT